MDRRKSPSPVGYAVADPEDEVVDLVSLVVSENFVGLEVGLASEVPLVGSLVGVDSYVGSPALFKVIAGILEENPGGGAVPGFGAGIIPGPMFRQLVDSCKLRAKQNLPVKPGITNPPESPPPPNDGQNQHEAGRIGKP